MLNGRYTALATTVNAALTSVQQLNGYSTYPTAVRVIPTVVLAAAVVILK